jgi:hypothetical protein
VYLSKRAKAALWPDTYSSARKRNGPQPTTSETCLNGSVAAAIRAGIITGCGGTFDRKCASSGNGRFIRQTRVRSSGASIASTRALIVSLTASRFSQRCNEARQSRASTFVPSWNSSPSRSRMVQRLSSLSMTWPSTICGCGLNAWSLPYRFS